MQLYRQPRAGVEGRIMNETKFPSESYQVSMHLDIRCPICGNEVVEHPLHKEDEPVEHEDYWHHKRCLEKRT